MSGPHLWHGRSVLQLQNIDEDDQDIIQACCVENNVFLLTLKGNIYRGILDCNASNLCLSVDKVNYNALDFGCTLQQIYIVKKGGEVLACTPQTLLAAQTNDLQFGNDGIKDILSGSDLHARCLTVGARGIAYIDDIGQLWASGWQKELGIDDPHLDSKPTPIQVFSGKHIIDVSLGADFGLVLLQPIENLDERVSPNPTSKNAITEQAHSASQHIQSVLANVDAATVYLKRQLSWVSGDVVEFVKNVGDFVPYRQRCESNESGSESFEELALDESVSECKSLTRNLEDRESQSNDSSVREAMELEYKTENLKISKSETNIIGATLQVPNKSIGSCNTLSSQGSNESARSTLRSSPARSAASSLTTSTDFSMSAANNPQTSEVGSSSTLNSSHGSEGERAWALSKAGLALLDTEVWSWGDARCGQLGQGDMVKRGTPCIINRLRKSGVRKVVCGSHYALALLLDGRVFIWGERRPSSGSILTSDTTPRQLELPNKLRAHDIAAHNDVSYVLAGQGRVFMLSRHSCYPEGIIELSWTKGDSSLQAGAHRVLCSSQICVVVASENRKFSQIHQERLNKEQELLEDIIEVRRLLIQKLIDPSSEVRVLLRCHQALMGATALHVAALTQLPMPTRPHAETLVLYQQFITALCDAIACGALHQAVSAANGKQAAVLATLSRPLDHISLFAAEAKSETDGTPENAKAWKKLLSESRVQLKVADQTREFWDSLANRVSLKTQLQAGGKHRRLVRDSREHQLFLVGASRFSGPHWFLLMTDCLAHIAGSQVDIHDLRTLWVDPVPDTQNLENALLLTVPESSMTVRCLTSRERSEWLGAFHTAIKLALHKPNVHTPPSARAASYTFQRLASYKGATYTGRWVQGVLEGPGRMEWIDGRVYVGKFHSGHMHGQGRQVCQNGTSYEGQWADGFKSGYGIEKSVEGDVYEGYFSKGFAHGHGVRKEGRFMSSAASVYVGEWACGRRHGYGVSDEISTGEKYLGLWSNDLKHGCGVVVTLDGIYYEGNFCSGTLTGHGVMVWEDGSCYEGEFGAAGVFAGKGRLSLSSGDQFEGTLHGAWNDGVKVSGVFHKNLNSTPTQAPPKPSLFGRLSVLAGEKWRPVFHECLRQLGVAGGEETGWEPGGLQTARAWEGVAVTLNQKNSSGNSTNLDTIPQYGRVTLDSETYHLIKVYLTKAFEERAHPLGLLVHQLAGAYTATYGGVRVHPVLLAPAVAELLSLSSRLYQLVRLLFPALPPPGHEAPLPPRPSPSMPDIARHERRPPSRARAYSDSMEQSMELALEAGESVALQDFSEKNTEGSSESAKERSPDHSHPQLLSQSSRRSSTLSNISEGELEEREVASAAGLLLPLLLPHVYSALFVLYALHNKTQDDEYWRKLLKWNRQRDVALMAFLGIERRFWPEEGEEHMFKEAVNTLQQLKTTFAPLEKLMVIRTTFQHMTKGVQEQVGRDFLWTMDALLPVFQLVVIRAQILQLGSEIHFVEDFMEPHLLNGELGIMFTTLKACYFQILQEKIN